jgi:hypothetical protein
MMFDIPMTSKWQGLVVIAMVVCSLFIWRKGLDIVRKVFLTRKRAAYWILASLGAACAVAGSRIPEAEYMGLVMVVLAVALEALDLRSKWRTTEATTLTSHE